MQPRSADRAPQDLPVLQVFQSGLLFLTFLPASARRSIADDDTFDPGMTYFCMVRRGPPVPRGLQPLTLGKCSKFQVFRGNLQ
jgi:hypothetical protein